MVRERARHLVRGGGGKSLMFNGHLDTSTPAASRG
jgi:hypothetical protein